MSRRAAVPLTNDVGAALARFFHAGAGPSHSVLTRVLSGTGFGDGYEYRPDKPGPTKEERGPEGCS